MKRRTPAPPRNAGFSLIELIVSLVILSLVLAFAVPSFARAIAASRASSGANEVLRGLSLARQNALQTGAMVALQPDPAGWSAGWEIARFDADPDDGQLHETVLAQSQFAPGTIEVTACDVGTETGGITFNALGRPVGPIADRKLVIAPQPHAEEAGLAILVSPAGVARVSTDTDCPGAG